MLTNASIIHEIITKHFHNVENYYTKGRREGGNGESIKQGVNNGCCRVGVGEGGI